MEGFLPVRQAPGGPCEPFNLYDESGKIKNKAGHMAIWQSRPEKNGLPPGKSYDEFLGKQMESYLLDAHQRMRSGSTDKDYRRR